MQDAIEAAENDKKLGVKDLTTVTTYQSAVYVERQRQENMQAERVTQPGRLRKALTDSVIHAVSSMAGLISQEQIGRLKALWGVADSARTALVDLVSVVCTA